MCMDERKPFVVGQIQPVCEPSLEDIGVLLSAE